MNGGSVRTHASERRALQRDEDAPALERGEFLGFNPSETRLLESADERVLGDAVAYGHGLKVQVADWQLLSRGARPGRETLVFQVTKRGLSGRRSALPRHVGARTHYFSSEKAGGAGVLPVSSQ